MGGAIRQHVGLRGVHPHPGATFGEDAGRQPMVIHMRVGDDDSGNIGQPVARCQDGIGQRPAAPD